MANIGLTTFRYSILTEATDGTPSYAGAQTPGKAVSFSLSVDNNDAKLYADDGLAEADTTFSGGTATLGLDDLDLETAAVLLGHTITEDGEMTRSTTDSAPYVGIGHVVTKMVGGVYKYKVEFLYKVKFSEPSQDNSTKGESVEFSTPELEGTVAALANGNWSVAETFDTKAAAITYLEGLMSANPASN